MAAINSPVVNMLCGSWENAGSGCRVCEVAWMWGGCGVVAGLGMGVVWVWGLAVMGWCGVGGVGGDGGVVARAHMICMDNHINRHPVIMPIIARKYVYVCICIDLSNGYICIDQIYMYMCPVINVDSDK